MINEDTSAYGVMAEHFTRVDGERLSKITVLPPYEPKNQQTPTNLQWVRGNIRMDGAVSGINRDLVVTGPHLTVVYGGCRWNRLVFALPGAANQEVYHFEKWLRSLIDVVKGQIWSNPQRYRPGSLTNARFTFDDTSCLKPSSNPSIYPDELVTKLSVRRTITTDTNGEEVFADIPDTDFLLDNGDGMIDTILPNDITAGSVIQPIFKISYNRNNERFGLVLTVLKAKVINKKDPASMRIENGAWVFDDPMEQV